MTPDPDTIPFSPLDLPRVWLALTLLMVWDPRKYQHLLHHQIGKAAALRCKAKGLVLHDRALAGEPLERRRP